MTATKHDGPLLQEPIRWWRLKAATGLEKRALRMMRAVFSKIEMLGEPQWKAAVKGDPAACIRISLNLRPENFADARFDLAMTALAICAADGNAAACLVMSHILRKIPGAGKAEARIATSWLTHAFGEVLSRRAEKMASTGYKGVA